MSSWRGRRGVRIFVAASWTYDRPIDFCIYNISRKYSSSVFSKLLGHWPKGQQQKKPQCTTPELCRPLKTELPEDSSIPGAGSNSDFHSVSDDKSDSSSDEDMVKSLSMMSRI